jgi:hypothetical protein
MERFYPKQGASFGRSLKAWAVLEKWGLELTVNDWNTGAKKKKKTQLLYVDRPTVCFWRNRTSRRRSSDEERLFLTLRSAFMQVFSAKMTHLFCKLLFHQFHLILNSTNAASQMDEVIITTNKSRLVAGYRKTTHILGFTKM